MDKQLFKYVQDMSIDISNILYKSTENNIPTSIKETINIKDNEFIINKSNVFFYGINSKLYFCPYRKDIVRIFISNGYNAIKIGSEINLNKILFNEVRKEKYLRLKKIADQKRIMNFTKSIRNRYNLSKLSNELLVDSIKCNGKKIILDELSFDFKITKNTIGNYSIANGLIAFVNDEVIFYVTNYTFDIEKQLVTAGYKERDFYIPFTCGERPSLSKDCTKLDLIQKKSSNEQKWNKIKSIIYNQ